MLTTAIVCFVLILFLIVGMAVGVMNGREPIKGSCGGLNKLGLRDGECPICGDDPNRCENNEGTSTGSRAAQLGRDVAK
jgi:hypothetical protein